MAATLTGTFFEKKTGSRMIGAGTWKAIFMSPGFVQHVSLPNARDKASAESEAKKLAAKLAK